MSLFAGSKMPSKLKQETAALSGHVKNFSKGSDGLAAG
jgi:hypothetical protein